MLTRPPGATNRAAAVTSAVLCGVALASAPQHAAAAPASVPASAPDGARLAFDSNAGDGCPAGTVTTDSHPAGTSLSMRPARFTTKARGVRSCLLAVLVTAPAGWAYAPRGVWFSGSATLGASMAAHLVPSFHQQADPVQADATRLRLTGPVVREWAHRATVTGMPAGGCGRTGEVAIYTQASVPGPSGSAAGTFSIDRLWLSVNDFAWQRCGRR